MTKKRSPVVGQDAGAERKKHLHDTSRHAQRQRLLAHLQMHGSITTIEARRDLDIFHPAGRVMELRRLGEPIDTVWVEGFTEQGVPHRVGRYVLAAPKRPE